ncbi:hypothetical protein ACP4OV_025233 [Aristida adscensionis]
MAPSDSSDNDGDYDYSDYEYDDSCESAGECSDADERAGRESEPRYVLETEAAVRGRHDDAVAKVCERLLRLADEWFSDDRRVRAAVGLPAAGAKPTVVSTRRRRMCLICFERHVRGGARSAGCAHFYCDECWRGYVRAAFGDGPACLSLRCPDPGCSAAVVKELVDAVAAGDEALRARYAAFSVRSFVEQGRSARIRWCPGPGCTLAVSSAVGAELREVACDCAHAFCFACGGEVHRPATCETAREWAAKNSSDRDTMDWVLANTKHCPLCRRPIQKNHGCMHMTCAAPCRHEFCWLCLGPWDGHGGGFYSCNRYDAGKSAGKLAEEEGRRRQAESLERCLHYYERWTANGASRDKARADVAGLRAGGLDAFAAAVGEPPATKQMDCLLEAYEQIVECRRMLRWSYAYCYYLGAERGGEVRLRFCEYLQGEAEASLDRLHHCAELEREELCLAAELGAAAADAGRFVGYREKLVTLTVVTGRYFRELVKGFEGGMAEVQL